MRPGPGADFAFGVGFGGLPDSKTRERQREAQDPGRFQRVPARLPNPRGASSPQEAPGPKPEPRAPSPEPRAPSPEPRAPSSRLDQQQLLHVLRARREVQPGGEANAAPWPDPPSRPAEAATLSYDCCLRPLGHAMADLASPCALATRLWADWGRQCG